MKTLIDAYLESKTLAWAETTLRSERARLYACLPALEKKKLTPGSLWIFLQKQKPYTRATTWTRVTSFWEWCQAKGHKPQGTNPFKEWRLENAKVFKNVYETRRVGSTYEEVEELLKTAPEDIRRTAAYILANGLRWSEVEQTGETITGKGGKVRPRFGSPLEGGASIASYKRVRCYLRRRGLRPHDLRKLFATRLAESGKIGTADLLRILGWNSIQTAQRYLQPKQDNDLRAIVQSCTE